MAQPRKGFRGTPRYLATIVVISVSTGCASSGPKSTDDGRSACVEVAGEPIRTVAHQDGSATPVIEVTSGDLLAGNFAMMSARLRNTSGAPIAKLYWVPKDTEIANTAALTVTVVDRNDVGKVASTQSFGGAGSGARVGLNGQYFWPTMVVFPSVGSWRIRGTAPGLVGACFDVEIS